MSSVNMADADQGVKAVLGNDSLLYLRDVHIAYMSTGISFNIEEAASVSMTIDKSTIVACRDGLRLERQNSGQHERTLQLVVTKSKFTNNTNYAIYINQSVAFPISVLVSHCVVEGSSQYTLGLYCDLKYSNLSIINSTFKSLGKPINVLLKGQCKNVNIEHNRVENTFSERHVDLYKYSHGNSKNCTLDLIDNIVRQDSGTGSEIGGIRVRAFYDTGRINLDRNSLSGINNLALYLYLYYTSPLVSICGNIITDCEKALYVEAVSGSATVKIRQNTVLRNFGTDIIRLGTAAFLQPYLEFERNTMRNNSNKVVSVESSNALLHYNIFNNPEATLNVELSESKAGGGDLNASLNYWGTVDSREIAGKLYDQKSDADLPLIIFQPYFENGSMSSFHEETLEFLTADGNIGGDVNGNVTLTMEGSPYIAVGFINVRTGDVLRVEAGVQIDFLPNNGILVEGIKILFSFINVLENDFVYFILYNRFLISFISFFPQ